MRYVLDALIKLRHVCLSKITLILKDNSKASQSEPWLQNHLNRKRRPDTNKPDSELLALSYHGATTSSDGDTPKYAYPWSEHAISAPMHTESQKENNAQIKINKHALCM